VVGRKKKGGGKRRNNEQQKKKTSGRPPYQWKGIENANKEKKKESIFYRGRRKKADISSGEHTKTKEAGDEKKKLV